jgi:hypothetical protein
LNNKRLRNSFEGNTADKKGICRTLDELRALPELKKIEFSLGLKGTFTEIVEGFRQKVLLVIDSQSFKIKPSESLKKWASQTAFHF